MDNTPYIQVVCPDDNIPEREYIINTLFFFIGLRCKVEFSDTARGYCIVFEGKTLIIEDHFFIRHQEDLSYFSNKNIPPQLIWFNGIEGIELPIIYGRDFFSCSKDKIICGLDIFASSFFMLSRWEEFVINQKNGKCDEEALFSVRNNIFGRPIVNEYCSLLVMLLKKIGLKIPVAFKKTEVLLTHDVDRCYLSTFGEMLVNTGKLLFKKPKKAILTQKRFLQYKMLNINPFNSFDLLMSYSEQYKFKNSFFFKGCQRNEEGFTYDVGDNFVRGIIALIEDRGHIIGFHPSENTLNNKEQFMEELERLRSVTNSVPIGGRSHGLFYPIGYYAFWDEAGLVYDSGCGFQFRNGFRAGVCQPYNIFDIRSRKKLDLLEKPFILMDSVWLRNKISPSDFYLEATKLIDIVFKYKGTLCLNWHSNLINSIEMKNFQDIYFKIVEHIGALKDNI